MNLAKMAQAIDRFQLVRVRHTESLGLEVLFNVAAVLCRFQLVRVRHTESHTHSPLAWAAMSY